MFEDLNRIFRKSMSAFRSELSRREPEDQVAELLTAMRREWVAARADLPLLAERLERARRELVHERDLLGQCERRGKLAEGIGDAETVRVAAEFAVRHRERVGVLEQKVAAAEAEQALRLREVAEMKRRYEEADANRFALLAEIRRRQGQARMNAGADSAAGTFDDWNRMEERISDSEAYVDALEELDPSPPPRSSAPSPDHVEERLRQLKRELGKG
ncbi:MAG: PspA/IM30 family protein [Gemmatimonadetes bacterium]|nr:PspA/IM30 family protein [Gemmatimonadota bacterium]